MNSRVVIYCPRQSVRTGTSAEFLDSLTRAVEIRGGLVVGTFADHGTGQRRNHNTRWKTLIANLAVIDQVAVMSAADLPVHTVKELLRLLGTLRDHGVGLFLFTEGIDTNRGTPFALLDVIDEFRRTKLSRAIRAGQAKALAAGKTIGRPRVPPAIRDRIWACVAAGRGIRPTANKYGVAPGTVINVCRSMSSNLDSPTK
jgi:DNA invertase Pin-like site-specific DNA recombinase